MSIGRSIRIFLDGGEVSGIRHAEIVNWTGQAILCPRHRIAELKAFADETTRPGIYFLFGAEGYTTREVYVGESEDIMTRLKQQQAAYEFWQEAIFFTSKDENVTKAHVKYLESKVIEAVKAAGRYTLKNDQHPPLPKLPRADQHAMDEFLQNLPILLGVLGHRALDPLSASTTKVTPSQTSAKFCYTIKDAVAHGAPTDDGFVVYAGSTALKQNEPTLTVGYRAMKEELIKSGRLKDVGSLFQFTEDTLFASPTAAAGTVYGNNVSGRTAWKTVDGKTLKELEQLEAATALI